MSLENACSHKSDKGEQRISFTLEFKKKVVEHALIGAQTEKLQEDTMLMIGECTDGAQTSTLWLMWLRSKVVRRKKDWKVVAEN